MRCDECGKQTGTVRVRFNLDWRNIKEETPVQLCDTHWDALRYAFGVESEAA